LPRDTGPERRRYRRFVATPDPDLTIADNRERLRYEAYLGADLAGVLEYRLAGTRRILVHTDVPEAFGGRGIGSELARHALEEARVAGARVTAKCPFVRSWLERHPEYADIVTPEPAARRHR
jgi:predicted GNAT family acetyltransferase